MNGFSFSALDCKFRLMALSLLVDAYLSALLGHCEQKIGKFEKLIGF